MRLVVLTKGETTKGEEGALGDRHVRCGEKNTKCKPSDSRGEKKQARRRDRRP